MPPYSVLAALTSTLIFRSFASGELSPTRLVSFAVPLRDVAAVTDKILSKSVVFPLK